MPKYHVVITQTVIEEHDGIKAESRDHACDKAKDRMKPDNEQVIDQKVNVYEMDEEQEG